MDHRTQAGRLAQRALKPRAGRGSVWRQMAVALVAVAVAGTSSLAAEPASKAGGWSWFKSKPKEEMSNPFDKRPIPLPKASPSNVQQASMQQTAGLSQPSFIVPSGEPGQLQQPRSFTAPGLEQPKWMQPQSMVVVTDDPAQETTRQESAKPTAKKWPQATKTAQQTETKARTVPKPQPTQPGVYGLLQGLAGTNVPTNTEFSNASTANSQLERSGGELVRQVAGVSKPQPGTTALPYPTTNMHQGLMPIWTDPTLQAQSTPQGNRQTGSPPAPPVQAAVATTPPSSQMRQASATRPVHPPVATSNDPASGLWTQMGFEPPPQTVSETPVPSGPQESVWSALLKPATLTNNAPTVPRPEDSATAKSEKNSKSKKNESQFAGMDEVPDLIRPFYVTNEPPAATRGTTSQRAASSPTEVRPLESTLAKQLMLTSDDYLRAAQDNSVQPTPPTDPTVAAAAFINQWSSMQNPFLMTQQAPQMAMVAPGAVASVSGGATQASFLQESLPDPNGAAKPDDIDLPGDDLDDEGDDGKDGEAKSLTDANRLGNAPEDNTLDFLRTQTVLLKPGDVQCDIGFQYQYTDNTFLFLENNNGNLSIGEVQFRGRELTVPLQIRYGVAKRVQSFLQVPVGWSNNQVSLGNEDIFQNDGGIGDIGFGATAQLCDATKDRPYMIGTLSASAPTGGDPFTGIIGFSPSAPSLGDGFWQLGGNLLWIETRYDPVIVFYGLGAAYQFEHRYIGIEFQPGPQYTYTFGYGFAVNERVTLSTQFFGAYQEELKANGIRIPGTNQEPMSVQLAATFLNRCNRIVEPFVTFGLTDDAVNSTVGITWTY